MCSLKVDCPAGHGESRFAQRFTQRWMHVAGARKVLAAGAKSDRSCRFID
jgi:hypothetical protein